MRECINIRKLFNKLGPGSCKRFNVMHMYVCDLLLISMAFSSYMFVNICFYSNTISKGKVTDQNSKRETLKTYIQK